MRADKSTPNIAIVAVDIHSDSKLYRQFEKMSVQDKSKALAKAYERIAEAFEKKDPNTLVICVSCENSITSPTTKFVSMDEKKVFLDTMKAVSAKHSNLLLEPGTMSSFRVFPKIRPQRILDSMLKNYEELEKSYPNLSHTEIQDAKNKILAMIQEQKKMDQACIVRNVSFAFYQGKIIWKRCKNLPYKETYEKKQDVSDLYFHPGRANNMCYRIQHGSMTFDYGKEICTEHGHARLKTTTQERPYLQIIMSATIPSSLTAFHSPYVVHVDSNRPSAFVFTRQERSPHMRFYQLDLLENLNADAKYVLSEREPCNPLIHFFDTATTLTKFSSERLTNMLSNFCRSCRATQISHWVKQRRNSDHKTALHLAAYRRASEESVRMLLANLADPNAKDINDKTALNYVIERGGDRKIVDLLRHDYNAIAILPNNLIHLLRTPNDSNNACLLLMMADKTDSQLEKLAKTVTAADLKTVSDKYVLLAQQLPPENFAALWDELENRKTAIGELLYLAYPRLHPTVQVALPLFSFTTMMSTAKNTATPTTRKTDVNAWLADLKKELEPFLKKDEQKYRL